MTQEDLPDRSIAETTAAVKAGDVSAVELAEARLARIAAAAGLNAFRTVTSELALEQAAAVDAAVAAGRDPGPLAGVQVALKDNIAVAGVGMTVGTTVHAQTVADTDAPVYAALRAAGAVLVGKLSMSEWAIGATNQNIHFGDVHNPWDPTRVSGGSSGGSGAAIGADLAQATLGTDTGGSIRLPAALNGCVGLRPSTGRVSNRGSIPVSWTLDTIGPLARRAEDVAAVFAVIAGYDHADPVTLDVPVDDYVAACHEDVRGLRVGVLGGWSTDGLETGYAAALRTAGERFAELGVTLEAVELDGGADANDRTAELLLAEAAAYHADRLRDTPEVFAPDVLARLRRGEGITGARYGELRQWQRTWRRQVLDSLAGFDALLLPASGRSAPTAAESDPLAMTAVLARVTAMWVTAGVPALAVPAGFVDGLPVSMQLIGRPFADATVLRLAAGYQRTTDWHLRRPDAAWPAV